MSQISTGGTTVQFQLLCALMRPTSTLATSQEDTMKRNCFLSLRDRKRLPG